MKKVFTILTLLSLALLVACGPKDGDSKNPVISGAVDIPDHVKGTPFDPLDGVTAADADGNDLTEDIVVEGQVDVNEVGDYTVKYSVEDSKGRKASKEITVTVYRPNEAPVITVPASSVVLAVGEDFNATKDVVAEDDSDGDLTAGIEVTSNHDKNKEGIYQVFYVVTDSDGAKGYATVNILVVQDKDALFNDVVNYKFASPQSRHALFAAAERYLLDNMVGGIPFYVASGMSLLSDRVTLPVEDYIPSYGWGTRTAQITKDDSEVFLTDGTPGNPGEYTYREWKTQSYGTLNFWIYDDSISADYLALIEGGFYRMVLNDNHDGWEFAPDLAKSAPIPGTIKDMNGKETSKTWTVELREDLEWAFKPGMDTTDFDVTLDANDFYWTYREALNQNFFRAISGGGDFVKEIAGAEAYAAKAAEVYGGDNQPTQDDIDELEALWEDVGIKKDDNLTLTFTFKNYKSEFDAYYVMGWPAMNQDLYEKHGSSYGTDENTVASSGEYIMTSHEAGKLTRFKKNDKYPHAEETDWTGRDIAIFSDAEVAFTAFLDGKLESAGVPNARIPEFITDPRLLQTPDTTTWRLNVNGLKTVEAQRAQFPGSTYVPEPILGYTDMRKALYYILDRQSLQEDWVPTSGIGISYFSSGYYVDPESGIPYRSTDQGKAVEDAYSVETWGYNKGLALSYFRSAVEEAIAEGYYEAGTAQNPTVITLEVRFMSLTESDATKMRADFVELMFEQLVDNNNHVRVEVNVEDTPFPGIYYDYQMVGEFDIAIGGISGSALDAADFLEVFTSDGRSGFTINWGFDSSLPNVPVLRYTSGDLMGEFELPWFVGDDVKVKEFDDNNATYVDPADDYEIVYFSFDALSRVLNGKTYVENGMEVPAELQEGSYDSWDALLDTFEDFFDPNAYPEFDELELDGDFKVIADESGLGGVWVVFPEGATFEAIKALFADFGFEYFTTEDYEGEWGPEFANESNVAVLYGPDYHDTDDEGANLVADYYGIVAPVDEDGNALVALLFY